MYMAFQAFPHNKFGLWGNDPIFVGEWRPFDPIFVGE